MIKIDDHIGFGLSGLLVCYSRNLIEMDCGELFFIFVIVFTICWVYPKIELSPGPYLASTRPSRLWTIIIIVNIIIAWPKIKLSNS